MRCKHKHLQLTETQKVALVWKVDGGVLSNEADIIPDDVTHKVLVECFDCHFSHTYNRYSKSNPKWLLSILDQITYPAREGDQCLI